MENYPGRQKSSCEIEGEKKNPTTVHEMRQTVISIKLELDHFKSCIRTRKSSYRLKNKTTINIKIQSKIVEPKLSKSVRM